jgi:hypothetical protein
VSSQKTKSIERDFSATRSTQSPPQEVTDRLAGLLPGEELEQALDGLAPEEITGPGGLLSQLAGRVIETALGSELMPVTTKAQRWPHADEACTPCRAP